MTAVEILICQPEPIEGQIRLERMAGQTLNITLLLRFKIYKSEHHKKTFYLA